MRWILVVAMVALVSCGADGEPLRPFGSAGVSVGTDGVSTNTVLGARNSNISVSVGF